MLRGVHVARQAELVDLVPIFLNNFTTTHVKKAVYLPGGKNLLSLGRLEAAGWKVDDGARNLVGPEPKTGENSRRTVIPIKRENNVYTVELAAQIRSSSPVFLKALTEAQKRQILIEHEKHGHATDAKGLCPHCNATKGRAKPFSKKRPEVYLQTEFGEVLHADTVGPIAPASLGGARYFVTIVDGMSRTIEAYPIKSKSDAADALQKWFDKYGAKNVKRIRTDNGTEFAGKWEALARKHGI
jgi:hypothetical protein